MITESEMQALRELFLECAGSLLESERKQTAEVMKGIESRLESIERKLDAKEELEKLKNRLQRLEDLTGFPVR